MIITFLMDNLPGNSLLCEHGLSLYIQTEKQNILLDTGKTTAFADNAQALGLSLNNIQFAVLSHAHNDHTGGLAALPPGTDVYLRSQCKIPCYSHHDNVFSPLGITDLPSNIFLHYINTDFYKICNNVFLIGNIQHVYPLLSTNQNLYIQQQDTYIPDPFDHEQQLVIMDGNKRLLFCGCAHTGIQNILAAFYQHFGNYPTHIVGGLHLTQPRTKAPAEAEQIKAVADTIKNCGAVVYTCHCTGQAVFDQLKNHLQEKVFLAHTGSVITI